MRTELQNANKMLWALTPLKLLCLRSNRRRRLMTSASTGRDSPVANSICAHYARKSDLVVAAGRRSQVLRRVSHGTSIIVQVTNFQQWSSRIMEPPPSYASPQDVLTAPVAYRQLCGLRYKLQCRAHRHIATPLVRYFCCPAGAAVKFQPESEREFCGIALLACFFNRTSTMEHVLG
jgi:hypothetical protein